MASPVYDGFDVDSESLLDEETSRVGPVAGQRGPSVSVSPSPFHVPVGVDIVATSDNHCVMTVVYPNEERPERSWRALSGDPTLQVQLGRYTNKVLAVRFPSALERLSRGPVQLPTNAADDWCSSLPENAQAICRRNIAIVRDILATMPEQIRLNVVKHLEKLTREVQHK